MWLPTDEFWLTLTGNNDESALLIALGIQPMRITAADPETGFDREGHIDIQIVFFNRQTNYLHGKVVNNETLHRLSLKSGNLVLNIDEYANEETCRIRSILGIEF